MTANSLKEMDNYTNNLLFSVVKGLSIENLKITATMFVST
jgi:hypothetical protein